MMNLSHLEHATTFKARLMETGELARKNLTQALRQMKVWYDQKARERAFRVGDKVLVLLPIAGNPLQARYHGPYTIEHCTNDVNYVVSTPEHRKQTQLCYINMLKSYHSRDDFSASESVAQVAVVMTDDNSTLSDAEDSLLSNYRIRLNNSQP